ncbi:BnaC05g51050D [Brassica napus]|uniref:BnaC05g51050D protein n=2 Tax=Brassica TaxID=3705 RepID=A0A078J236_BRANA|nr:BnaC05g51050D [Brassica napus]
MSSNGKSALSGDSSSEKPKGVQAESYSGPINPIDTPCVSSSHSIGEPYSKQAKVVVSVSSGLTKLSVPDSKKPTLSREMFDKWEAQKWWGENFEKVMEFYNVQQLNQQSVPVPTAPPRSKYESCSKNSPATPPLNKECPGGKCLLTANQARTQAQSRYHRDSSGLATTPKLSSISGTRTETSSVDMSARSSGSSREEEEEEEEDGDYSMEVSVSNASDMETEWVEQDEDGVYITIRALPAS